MTASDMETMNLLPPSQPPRGPSKLRRAVILSAAAGGLLLGIAALASTPTDHVNEPQPTVTGPFPDSTWKAPATTVGGLAAPRPTDPPATTASTVSQREAVAAWWAAAEADAAELEQHAGTMGVMFTTDPEGVLADPTEANKLLRELQQDVRALKAHGPIPVASVNRPWQKALSAYGEAFDLVYGGINAYDTEAVMEGAVLMAEANGHMADATAALGDHFNTG